MKIGKEFYLDEPVNHMARAIVGKILVVNTAKGALRGRIVETEAYHQGERACHAYGGKKTPRTRMLFSPGGFSYVYLCYGIHALFNIVTGMEGTGEAVLIRALEPLEGLAEMERRRGKTGLLLTNGPGKLTRAMGIELSHNGTDLTGKEIWLEDDGFNTEKIRASPRVGVEYAGEDAKLPWRFSLYNSKWVSVQ